ncbi:rho gtpase-activating protein 1 [Stylonychia lemnae]|uniref:Rho gtpase-activating protein 1 n=1 Tax=Stylonychia lemnae TaxID=5949 RepID=A0A078AET7_STYLE|nr:rho gtpase-activating protein 1 [Stylonychia lemnae]|eukprot:CDW80341.1 rho gtpase-activating protein 1 [Stylonychia lemnae]
MELSNDLSIVHEVDSGLEESKKINLRGLNLSVKINQNDNQEPSSYLISMTQASMKRNDQYAKKLLEKIDKIDIDKSAQAYLWLSQKGILSNIGKISIIKLTQKLGQNRDGVYYFVIYGYAYEKEQNKKLIMESFIQISEHFGDMQIFQCISLLNHSFKWKLIYVHSNVGASKKGALLKFKSIYQKMDDQQRNNLQQIYIVQPSLYVQSRLIVDGCISKSSKMNQISTERAPVFLIYQIMIQNKLAKVFAQAMTQLIQKYFQDKKKRISNPDLFMKLDKEENIQLDLLETQITLGNYRYLQTVNDSKIVMNYLRSILRCMEEPLCTYQFFPLFKKIGENLKKTMNFDQIVEQIRNLLLLNDGLLQDTWKFLLQLLNDISSTRNFTKKYLAQIFSDIVFKSPQFWASDTNQWQYFWDLLALMISKIDVIFEFDQSIKGVEIIHEKIQSNSGDVTLEEYSLWDPDTQDKFKGLVLSS